MARFPEAEARMFIGIFICKACKSQRRAPVQKVLNGLINCRNCGSKRLRPKKKKK